MADQVAARGGDYYMMKPCRIASVVERVRLLAAQHWSEGGENPAGPATARQTLESNVTAIIHEINFFSCGSFFSGFFGIQGLAGLFCGLVSFFVETCGDGFSSFCYFCLEFSVPLW